MTEDVKEKKDVVPSAYRAKYKETGGTCGDFIAEGLTKVTKDGGLDSVKAENGIDAARWGGFNVGMQRMNLANTLRARFLKGETVKILGREYNAKHQAEDFNGTVANSPAVLLKLAEHLGLQANEKTAATLGKLFFPPAPKGPTAEERAAAKAAKSEESAKLKADNLAKRDAAKAEKTAAADKAKTEKAAAAAKAKLAKDEAKVKADAKIAREAAKADKAK